MKKFLFALLVILSLAAFFLYPKAPKFVRINTIDFSALKDNKLKTELDFTNPNYFSLELIHQDIQVFVSDRHIGNISQDDNRSIHSKENFSLPIDLEFDKKEVFGKTGFLKSLISSTINDNLNVRFSGTIKVKVLGITLPVPVDHSQKILENPLGKKD